jgi:antitoxin VapB
MMAIQTLARLFRNGSNQALRIPREFELERDEAILYKEGDRIKSGELAGKVINVVSIEALAKPRHSGRLLA